jgi:hypothetical protein
MAGVGDTVPGEIAAWLACLVFVMSALLLGIKLVKEFRGRPAASDVQAEAAARYVTKQQCDKLHEYEKQTLEHLFSKVGGVERGAQAALGMEVRQLREERKVDAHVLQGRLSRFEEQIGGLKMATDLQTAQLNRIDTKLDNIILKQ